ncbi:MAG TPA: ATP-binding protein [Candidatus Saccharimonadales bacterium]|nr:ATP-binding protein [Candidatus Saccharimonadales bacterium]
MDGAEIERQRGSLAAQNDQLEKLVNAAKHDIGVLQNTEKRLEHMTLELQIKHQILNSVVEGTTDLIYIRDLNNRFTLANGACARLFGYSVEEIVGKNMRELLPNDTYAAVAQSDQEIVRTGATCTIEETAEIDGSTRFFLTTKGPDRDAMQNIIGTIGISREITERKKSEDQLATANRELDAFAYSVAHDLRAPIRHIDGFSKLLVECLGASLDEDAKHYLETIQGSARDMGVMVDDLLNLSRVARMELKLQVTALNSLVEQVLQLLKLDLMDRKIEWKIADLPHVKCDSTLVKQVFVNLLSNAVKFTRTRPGAVIEVGEIAVDGQPAIYVRDNGVGFNMKYSDKLFGVFQRLHAQEEFEGTGVGLATVQRIVQKHGGRIWAEAELNEGATFYFTLGTAAHAAGSSKETLL